MKSYRETIFDQAFIFLLILLILVGILYLISFLMEGNHRLELEQSYCKDNYGNSSFLTISEREYPSNIKVCNVFSENGTLIKRYFNTEQLK